jgi:Icc protein
MNRRETLKKISIASILFPLSGTLLQANSGADAAKHLSKKRVLRIAHLTDVHVQPELEAAKGFSKCLHHVQSLPELPDIIFNGGDCVMDSLKQDKARVQTQWDLWHGVLKSDNSLMVEGCIGNHDVWGGGPKTDPLYGKKYATEMLHLNSPYRSFDKNGWHFVVLDSTHPVGEGWIPKNRF